MVLEVVKYGHPVLRKKGAKIEKLTPEVRKLISDMLETMRAAHGVGRSDAAGMGSANGGLPTRHPLWPW